MTTTPSRRVPALVLADDIKAFHALATIQGYAPHDPELKLNAVTATFDELSADQAAFVRAQVAMNAARDKLAHTEQRAHGKMLLGGFIGNGYVYIGMDHFALPGDALAAAKRQGRLHRNFQGYSTQPDCDLIGLGVSAIGRMGATYSQNAKTLDEYYDALRQGQFPVVRGLALTRDDLVSRAVIIALMCQGRVEFESIDLAHLVNMRTYFAAELAALEPLAEGRLVEIGKDYIQVTATGWFFVRGVAMVFDRHLQADKVRERFSRII